MSNPNKLALIIGIDSYDNNDLDPLPSCKKDAQELYEFLLSQKYGFLQKNPLIGSKMGKEGWITVRRAIVDFFADAKPSQTLVFYFSGHGIYAHNEIYLASAQIDPKKPSFAGYALSDLTKRMAESKSQQIVGIIDACYSGSAKLPDLQLKKKAANDDADRSLATYDTIWEKTPKTKGIVLLLSSQGDQFSIAVENSNSLYTYHLLEGLRGIKFDLDEMGRNRRYSGSINDNGEVTPLLLHDYVYYKVANISEQVPRIKTDVSAGIIIAEHPEKAVNPVGITDFNLLFKLLQEERISEFNEIVSNRHISYNFQGVLLRKKNLRGANLAGIRLHHSDFSFSNLADANLERSYLAHVCLLGAHLERANLSEVNLSSAKLIGTFLNGANLFRAYLVGANLKGADLSSNDPLKATNLNHTDLGGAKLNSANLSGSILTNAILTYADLEQANLSGANLKYSNLEGANLTHANIWGANLSTVIMEEDPLTTGIRLESESDKGNNTQIREALQQIDQKLCKVIVRDNPILAKFV